MPRYRTRESVNKSISKISGIFTPVTLKSIAEPYQQIIYSNKSSRRGQIKSYTEVNKEYKKQYKGLEYPKEFYDELVYELINDDIIGEQLTVRGAVKYQRERANYIIEDMVDFYGDENLRRQIDKINDKRLLYAIEKAGINTNVLKDTGNYNYSTFYELLLEELELDEE